MQIITVGVVEGEHPSNGKSSSSSTCPLTMALAGVGARVNSSVVAKIASNRLIEASCGGSGDRHRD
jgi:hypothetical protein